MDLPTKQIEEYVSESMSKNYECEMVMDKNHISIDGFNRMLKFVNKKYSLEKVVNRESLDIRTSNSDIRLSIIGKDNILEYCKTNSIPSSSNIIIISKKRALHLPPIVISDYDIKLNVNIEQVPSDDDQSAFLNKIKNEFKFFRYKKRYTFTDEDKSIKIDITVVKSSEIKKAKTLIRSKTLSNIEEYEVEIEILNESISKPNVIVERIVGLIENLTKLNQNVKCLLPKIKKENILEEYVKLIDPNVDMEMFKQNKTKYILRYQPITLMKRNLLEPDIDVVSILEDYSCTEKTDGERYLLFIDKHGDVYFINSRLIIFPTNLKHPSLKRCIVDGEYVTQGKLNTTIDMYMCFDCYFVDGKDVRDLDLDGRLTAISDLLKNWETKEPYIQLKKFFYGSKNVMIDTKKCINNALLLPYHTDGLVFTPTNLSPGALYENDQTMNPFGGTWNKVFKWKPPEENTIDVLVKLGEECMVHNAKGVLQKCVYADLYVAYRGSIESTLNILDMYNNIDKSNKKDVSSNTIIKRFYDFTYLPVNDNDKYPCTNFTNEIIESETIVEMAYIKDSPFIKWTPLRLRKDKTAVMKQTNSIENAANNYNTVMNVWMSISDEVTVKMLTGEDVLIKDEVKMDNADLYYARETPRNRSLLRPMLDFHNFWVKKKNLFDLFSNKNYTLLEIGCGQAGDLPKWIDCKFSRIVGIDNNEDNLLNTNHGAYKRVLENISSIKTKFNKFNIKQQSFIFLLLDGGVKWTSDMVENIKSEEFAYLTKVSMGLIEKNKINNTLLKKSFNSLNEPFDLISCQFAVHYFFKNMDTLDAFCHNVNHNLKVNGYFIGTCLDGNSVNNAFINKETSILKGEINKKVLWQIEKKYDSYEQDSKGNENLGKHIDVYVETINKIIPEYLVDFELFKRKLSKYNIHLVDVKTETNIKVKASHSSGSFGMLWDTMVQSNKKGYKHWAVTNAIDNMDDVIQEYSFMNRWFIFKKM